MNTKQTTFTEDAKPRRREALLVSVSLIKCAFLQWMAVCCFFHNHKTCRRGQLRLHGLNLLNCVNLLRPISWINLNKKRDSPLDMIKPNAITTWNMHIQCCNFNLMPWHAIHSAIIIHTASSTNCSLVTHSSSFPLLFYWSTYTYCYYEEV